jgi:hypothetical protein
LLRRQQIQNEPALRFRCRVVLSIAAQRASAGIRPQVLP